MHFDKNELYSIESNIDGKRISLYDIASWKNGLAFKNIDFSDSGMPVIKIAELNNGISSSTAYTNKKYSNDVFLTKGDFVFSWSGNPYTSIDIFRYNLPDGWLNQHIFKVVPNEKLIIKDYFFYLMKFIKPNFIKIATNKQTTGLGHVTLNDIKQINFKLPNFDTQYKISKILYYIDEKIAINNATNNNLEQQAMALFNNYFPYKIDDLLPNNWRIGTLGEIIELHDSKRIPLSGQDRAQMQNKIYPYYGAASLMDYVDNYIFDGIYLLLGEDGTVVDNNGMPILQYVWGKFWVNNHAHIISGKCSYNVESLYLLFKQTPIKSIITGAVQAKISQANLKALNVVIPPESLLIEFNSKIENLFALIRMNKDENRQLTQLRDTLLPKLMSGEIDVANVKIDEKFDGSSTDKLSFSEK